MPDYGFQGDFMKKGFVLTGFLLAGATMPALAQSGSGVTEAVLEEIVVTSRLRSEKLMDVPMAVSVFTDKAIERAGIGRPEDFIALVPNMTIVQSQDSGTSFISVRGLTQVRNSESPVALVIDGVLAASPMQLTQELFDIAQIEVMKGPQSALYGRNAISGAISIRTRQPTNDMEGWVRVGLGDAGRTKAQGSLSGPLVKDQLFFRVAAPQVENDDQLAI
jgi:iron complex outermembrane receptor protein